MHPLKQPLLHSMHSIPILIILVYIIRAQYIQKQRSIRELPRVLLLIDLVFLLFGAPAQRDQPHHKPHNRIFQEDVAEHTAGQHERVAEIEDAGKNEGGVLDAAAEGDPCGDLVGVELG